MLRYSQPEWRRQTSTPYTASEQARQRPARAETRPYELAGDIAEKIAKARSRDAISSGLLEPAYRSARRVADLLSPPDRRTGAWLLGSSRPSSPATPAEAESAVRDLVDKLTAVADRTTVASGLKADAERLAALLGQRTGTPASSTQSSTPRSGLADFPLSTSRGPAPAKPKQVIGPVRKPAGEPARPAGEPTVGPAKGSVARSVERPVERPAAQAKARLAPAARLDVAAPGHAQVRTCGLASFIPAHHVHARKSTAVVTANDCTLRSVDHYHVRRVSLDFDPLLRDRAAFNALRLLADNPHDPALRAAFERHLDRLAGPRPAPGQTQESLPVTASAVATVTSSDVVQQGDGSTLNATTNYHLRETFIPIVEILQHNKDLVPAFAASLASDAPPAESARVLRALLAASGDVEDLDLLAHADVDGALPPDTSVLSLFGWTTVSRASAIMLGTGNVLETRMELDRPGLRRSDVLQDMARVRTKMEHTTRLPELPAAAPPRPSSSAPPSPADPPSPHRPGSFGPRM
jgi:hypothetical protein